MIATKVKIIMEPKEKILLKRHLNKNGKGQRFFTHEVRRLCTPYIPRLTGFLAGKSVTETENTITYNTPYARRQYYEHKGKGLRGPEWDKRMWNDKGKEIIEATAKYCGGKVK